MTEGIKEETCKYCHNFYSTLCPKCGVYTGKGVPDYCCYGDKKEVQKNWKNYIKVKDMLEQCLTEIIVGRRNGKGKKCLEALVKREIIKRKKEE